MTKIHNTIKKDQLFFCYHGSGKKMVHTPYREFQRMNEQIQNFQHNRVNYLFKTLKKPYGMWYLPPPSLCVRGLLIGLPNYLPTQPPKLTEPLAD